MDVANYREYEALFRFSRSQDIMSSSCNLDIISLTKSPDNTIKIIEENKNEEHEEIEEIEEHKCEEITTEPPHPAEKKSMF